MRSIHKNSLSVVKYTLFFFAMSLAEGAQDTRIFTKLFDFLIGEDDADNENASDSTLTFFIMCTAAIPLVLTMLSTWKKKHTHQSGENYENNTDHKSSYEEDYLNQDYESALLQNNNIVDSLGYGNYLATATLEATHQHSCIATTLELVTIGGPFATLAFAGLNTQLQSTSSEIRYTFSTLGALVAGFGNYQLHEAHAHAEDGVCTLFKQIPKRQKPKIILICLGVITGHFFQGCSAGFAFVDSLSTNTKTTRILNYSIPSLLAVLVTLFEAITETRSMLLLEINESDHPVPLLTKLATGMAASVHGSIPILGVIQFTEFLMQQFGQASLVTLPWYFRVGLLSLATVLFGLPNARGFYCTTLLTTNQALKTTFHTLAKGYRSLLWYGTCKKPKTTHIREYSSTSSSEMQGSLTIPNIL